MLARFSSLLKKSRSPRTNGQAHITFGGTSVGRSFARTRLLLKKQLWIWPIIAVVLLAIVGIGIRIAIERTIKHNLQSQLQTLLTIERSMLETWLDVQESNAESLANDQQIRQVAAEILAAAQSAGENSLETQPNGQPSANSATLNAQLASEMAPGMSAHDFVSFFLADKQFQILASNHAELIGQAIPKAYEVAVSRAMTGRLGVSPPYPSTVTLKDEFGRVQTGVATMHAVAPIRDANFQVVAVLGLRIRPEHGFTQILQLGRMGDSGETYAINKEGTFITNSRFDEQLILLGLLPDKDDSHSLLNLAARDPGGNLQAGFRAGVRRRELPLTKAAETVVGGEAGIDLDGYRDYRGVPVVGAWQWLPEYEMGLITEMDHAEAYRPLVILRWAFFSMFGLLILASVAIFGFTIAVARLRREAQKAEIDARHLGQYRLEEKIGAGAMGMVYRGQHAMLRRPTAIKLLDVDKVNEASIERFEREVQITCKLNHPNTVAIFDYGRTPEGVFYYAMEYLDGINLQLLVDRYGPQSEGRVIRILKQICGSLYEAHLLGLVHRDIKPANVMLNRRGGEPDIVKVLDFGLVRALDEAKQSQQTGGLTGTPLYMSPEAIQTPDLVDPRSDLYAVGAIGYFLLTGQPVFDGASLVDLCQKHLNAAADPPSQRLGRAVSPELENALLACLEKTRAKRPQTARDLAALLDRAPTAGSWTLEEAEAWWGRHERSQNALSTAPAASSGSTASGNSLPTNGSSARTASSAMEQTMAHDAGRSWE
jgi:serine/threonine protein kinase